MLNWAIWYCFILFLKGKNLYIHAYLSLFVVLFKRKTRKKYFSRKALSKYELKVFVPRFPFFHTQKINAELFKIIKTKEKQQKERKIANRSGKLNQTMRKWRVNYLFVTLNADMRRMERAKQKKKYCVYLCIRIFHLWWFRLWIWTKFTSHAHPPNNKSSEKQQQIQRKRNNKTQKKSISGIFSIWNMKMNCVPYTTMMNDD